ncbi:hypothetical protein DIPPA_21242 [Diplonema papillatum]|nr:hypothetical protein DIPPA_21242 [Diplonema papillatum]
MSPAWTPCGELLPAELGLVRGLAETAVIADRAADMEGAIALYGKAADRLATLLCGGDGGGSNSFHGSQQATALAAREMEAVYRDRKAVLERVIKERSSREAAMYEDGDGEPNLDPAGPDAYCSDESWSDGEREAFRKKNANPNAANNNKKKMTFKEAAHAVRRLVGTNARFRAAGAARAQAAPAAACKKTGRPFLPLVGLTARSSAAIAPLYLGGQPHVLWAAFVHKKSVYHRHFAKHKIDHRTAVLTPEALYIGASHELVRCVPILNIKAVYVANDGFIAVVVPSQYDLLFQPQEQKIESIESFLTIVDAVCTHHGTKLKIVKLHSNIDPHKLSLRKPPSWFPPEFKPIRVEQDVE